jgi:acyl-CoA thioesterase I
VHVIARARRRWTAAPTWQRIAVVGVTGLLAIAAWLGWGFLSVLRQVEPYAAYWDARARQPGELLYVALGDSAAQGIGASEPQLGYVGLLADRIEEATGRTVRVLNLSVGGAVAADVVAEQLPQLAGLEPDVLTVAIGGNDVRQTSPDAFREAFAQLVDGLPAGAYVADLPDFGGGPMLEDALRLSAIARDELAEHPELVAVALEAGTGDSDWGDLAPDFFHPGDPGYVFWADAFWAQIRQRL